MSIQESFTICDSLSTTRSPGWRCPEHLWLTDNRKSWTSQTLKGGQSLMSCSLSNSFTKKVSRYPGVQPATSGILLGLKHLLHSTHLLYFARREFQNGVNSDEKTAGETCRRCSCVLQAPEGLLSCKVLTGLPYMHMSSSQAPVQFNNK